MEGDFSAAETHEITRILQELRNRPELFNEKLFPLLYEPMRRMARRQMLGESSARTLQPTLLVNEAYMRMFRQKGDYPDWKNRAHFMACACNVLEQVLVDYARKRLSHKRGGGAAHVPIEDRPGHRTLSLDDILSIHEALGRLRALDATKAELMKLKFFGGLTIQEAASVMGIGLTTAKEHLRSAQAWMNRELGGGGSV